MRDFRAIQMMDKKGEADPGGANPPATPPATPPAQPPAEQPPAKAPPKIEEEGPETDELGYPIVKAPAKKEEGDPAKKADDKKKDPASEPKEVDPLPGYDKEPEAIKEDEKKEELPPKDPPTDLDKKLEGLHKSFADKVKEQIARVQKLGLDAEKEKGLIDVLIADKKIEQADAVTWQQSQQRANDRALAAQKSAWHKELKEDPVFGGEKLLTNASRSAKVMAEYGPELKKELTDSGVMLRPNVVRMLSRIADAVYPDPKMVQGDPPVDEKKESDEKSDDPLAFYNS